MAAILFVENVFYTAVLPLIPDYAQRYGLSQSGAGLLIGAYAAGVILGSIPGSWLARRIGFPRVAAVGLWLLSGGTLVFGLAHDVVLLDCARVLQGVGGGLIWMGSLGWVGQLAPVDQRGAVIGTVMSIGVAGALLGPLSGGAAVAIGPEVIFSLLAIVQLALGVVVLTMSGEVEWPAVDVAAAGPLPRGIVVGMSLVALPAALIGTYEALTPLQLDGAGASTGLIATVFVLGAAGEIVIAPLAGRLSDRIGRLRPLRLALVFAPLLCLTLSILEERLVLAAVAIIAWLAITAAFAPALALVADVANADPHRASRHWATLNIVLSAGVLLGSTVGALLAQSYGEALPYVVIAVGCGWVVLHARTFVEGVAVEPIAGSQD